MLHIVAWVQKNARWVAEIP